MSSKENDNIGSGKDVWNIALGYTTLKILKHLIATDDLIEIAKFGTLDINDSFLIDDQQKILARVEALKRLYGKIRIIISNTINLVSKKSDREKMEDYKKQIETVSSFFDTLLVRKTDQRNGIIQNQIYEPHFNNILEVLIRINEQVNNSLNESGLIFPLSKEFDMEEIQRKFIEGG